MSWYEQGGSSQPPQSPSPGTPSQSPTPPPAAAPPAPPPVAPGYDAPPPKTGTEGTAIASLVVGIVSLIIFGVILGAIAIVLGNKAKKKIAASGGQLGGSGLATAGQILGVLGIIGSIIVLVFILG